MVLSKDWASVRLLKSHLHLVHVVISGVPHIAGCRLLRIGQDLGVVHLSLKTHSKAVRRASHFGPHLGILVVIWRPIVCSYIILKAKYVLSSNVDLGKIWDLVLTWSSHSIGIHVIVCKIRSASLASSPYSLVLTNLHSSMNVDAAVVLHDVNLSAEICKSPSLIRVCLPHFSILLLMKRYSLENKATDVTL